MMVVDLFRALYSRKLLAVGIFFAIVGAGMTVTLLLTPTYESTMKVLITRDRIDPRVTADENRSDTWRSEFSEEEFNSEMEILQSRAVIEGVVKQLELDKQEANAPQGWLARLKTRFANSYRSLHKQTAPDATERAVTRLSEQLEVVSVKKSRIIKVTYRDNNPERAAQTLNEMYRQYGEHHLRLRQSSKAANVFHEQSEAFNQKLKEATDALKRFDERTGVSANSAQQTLQQQQYYEVQSQLDKARTEMRETEKRIAALSVQIKTQPERVESEARTKYAPALDKIKEEILALELQRTQLLQKYQPNHRLVKDVEERLAQSRELLAREEKSPPQERATVLNEIHRRLTSELLSAHADLAALREREQKLAALATQYKEKVTSFDTKSLERAALERARAVNEEAYLLYRKKAQEADIVNALNQERIVNFSLAEAPAVNRRPVSPKPLINLIALTMVGLVAAAAAVAFIEREMLFSREERLLATPGANLPAMGGGGGGLPRHQDGLLTPSDQSQRNDHQFFTGGETKLLPEKITSGAGQRHRITRALPPEQNSVKADRSTDSDKTSESDAADAEKARGKRAVTKVLPSKSDSLETRRRRGSSQSDASLFSAAGWQISPAEIDEIFSLSASPQPSPDRQRPEEEASTSPARQRATVITQLNGQSHKEETSVLDSQPDEISSLPEPKC